MGFNFHAARDANQPALSVSIPNRELVGFQLVVNRFEAKEVFVSIPNRELVGFQHARCPEFEHPEAVSIPNRELVGFQLPSVMSQIYEIGFNP